MEKTYKRLSKKKKKQDLLGSCQEHQTTKIIATGYKTTTFGVRHSEEDIKCSLRSDDKYVTPYLIDG